MGNKKKFIDKKKSATFQLLSRDSSDPVYESGPSADRVFVRVDNNPYTVPTLHDYDDDGDDNQQNDGVLDNEFNSMFGSESKTTTKTPLPDDVRREILELGFPDDGYNYLIHLREIRNTGGGSAYYENPKAKLEELPLDVKAYDASRLDISKLDDESNEKAIYSVASKTVNVRLQKAVDPEVAALLDDSDLSAAGSDVDDFEEDFVIKANLPEGPVDEELDKKLRLVEKSADPMIRSKDFGVSGSEENAADFAVVHKEKPRVRRPLDEQFDMLELQEYGTDSEDEYANYVDAEEDEYEVPLAEKLNHALKDHPIDGLELDDKYKLPFDLLHNKKGAEEEEPLESAADVILRCREYAEKYENEDEDEKVIVYQESSDESEVWDCETIVSTYSNLDNHPGKIGAPEARRKKKLAETVSSALSTPNHFITLKGKEKLPVDFLPHGRKHVAEKTKDVNSLKTEPQKRKQHGQESKEEKKERKAAVKEERREARRMKKETKELYRCEAQRAQKVAAFTGPSGIHLM